MNTLRLPLSELANSPVLAIEATVDEAAIRPEGASPLGLRDVVVAGVLSKIDTELFFQGTVHAALEGKCDRCLSKAAIPLDRDVEWFFEPRDGQEELDAEDGEVSMEYHGDALNDIEGTAVRLYAGEELDLSPSVWEECVFTAPTKFLCKENCKGLCPQCGANLNETTCNCDTKTATGHQGLANLKDLYPDLPDKED